MRAKESKAARVFKEPKKTLRNLTWYRRRLDLVARAIAQIVREYDASKDPLEAVKEVQQNLFAYEQTLQAWALEVAALMITRVARDDYETWKLAYEESGREISKATRSVLESQETGSVFYDLQRRQVDLITSLPHDAAQKVHDWTIDGLDKGQRPEAIKSRIRAMLPDEIKNRAQLIARTETARARSNFTEARARALGSTHYIWHTVGDARVRPMHAALNGTVQSWDDPPITDFDHGMPVKSHPGCVWNCRCFASPLLPNFEG